MEIKLRKRYPNSRTEDITDAYSRGYSVGYDMGYEAGFHQATRDWEEECRRLRDVLSAILGNGEAPEHGTKEPRTGEQA